MKTPNIFFASDHHINHANIIKYCNRPFSSVDEMNEGLIEAHNKIVKPHDDVFFLGDFLFVKNDTETLGKYLHWLSRFNGRICLITGNHDNVPIVGFFNPVSIKFRIDEIKIQKIEVTLSHFPQLSWNRSHHGAFNLHGHHHGTLPFDPALRRMDVGVDCNEMKPFEWSEIQDKLLKIPVEKSKRIKSNSTGEM